VERPALDAPASEWLVYGDALQGAGDPLGELIGISHAVAEGRIEPAVRDGYVRRHWKALLGKCPPGTGAYDFEWNHTGLRAVTVRNRRGEPDPIGPLLGAAAIANLQAITVCAVIDERPFDLGPRTQKLAVGLPSTCRSFAFVDERATRASMLVSSEFSPGDNLVGFGSLEPFWPRAVALSLDVADCHQIPLGAIDAPELRAFALRSLRFVDGAGKLAPQLAEARWPRLESLELRLTESWIANVPLEREPYISSYSDRIAEDPDLFDDADEGEPVGVDWGALAPVLRTLAECPLRRLALTSFASTRSLLETLARAQLPATLEELDLSDSAIGDTDVEWFMRHRDRLRSLRRLVVERTAISTDAAAYLRALGPEIRHSSAETAPRYRYVVGQE
jgi:hypothetical protein